ncbi:secreted protein containing Cellulosome anchoring protein, cohesin region domain protein [Candidatus Magnetomorum sp. HK-1]|nr:secreted protein containing Cellulosome anchoring protein, cohesin region domain protein [Candidatus Magnetomorum sp. HK-1]
MNKKKLILLIAIQLFAIFKMSSIDSFATTFPKVEIRKGQLICIPVYINQLDEDIIGLDLAISYSSQMFEIKNVSLNGGILETNYSLTVGDQIKDKLYIGIYASNGVLRGKGNIIQIWLLCKQSHQKQSDIRINKYVCNDIRANGGFFNNNDYENMTQFIVMPVTLKDIIYALQLLSGIQSDKHLIDMTGDGVIGMNDILRLMKILQLY